MQEQPEEITLQLDPQMTREGHDRVMAQLIELLASGAPSPPELAQVHLLVGIYQVLLDIRDRLPPRVNTIRVSAASRPDMTAPGSANERRPTGDPQRTAQNHDGADERAGGIG